MVIKSEKYACVYFSVIFLSLLNPFTSYDLHHMALHFVLWYHFKQESIFEIDLICR
jgi:hypothetical protein